MIIFSIIEDTNPLQKFIDWLSKSIPMFLKVGLIALIAIVAMRICIIILSNFLQRTIRGEVYTTALDREKRINTLQSICNALIRFTIIIIAGFMILDALGINTAPLLASAGIIGVALGFGTQSLVKDFISGMFIIIENQYRVGDFIEIQNVAGTVESISMRTTVLRDADGSVHNVPNGSIIVSTNRTMGEGHSVIDATVAADADLGVVETIVNEVGKDMAKDETLEGMMLEAPHFMRISEFTDKGVLVKVSISAASGKQLDVKSAFLMRLQSTLQDNDIKMISASTTKAKK